MTNMLYGGYGERTSITLHWRSSVSCCSTDTRASRRPRYSVYIYPCPWPTRAFTLAYSVAVDSPVRAGLQHRCRLPRPHWLMPQPTHLLSGLRSVSKTNEL